jgi:stearoyl-CoA desaturase (delta-9 desaturase)
MVRLRRPDETLDPILLIPHVGIPIAALIGAVLVPFHWWYPPVAVGLYFVRMLFLTAGYHRYFSHRAFKTSRPFQLLLGLVGTSCMQRGPLWWAAQHRAHHRYADTPKDPHSPLVRGLFQAHMGWLLVRRTDAYDAATVHDLALSPELRWLERHYAVVPAAMAIALYAAGGVGLLVWGFLVSTSLLWHGTYCINSIAHRYGSVRYATGDGSRNNWALALLTLGEGWHNNHHHFRSSARQGFFWWEVDVTYYVLRALAWTGLVWDLREVPRSVRESQLVARPASPDRAAPLPAAP